jgi:Na+/H+ antiporter NhaD/arsenite permease-like protein
VPRCAPTPRSGTTRTTSSPITAVIFIAAYVAIAAGRVPFLRLDRTGVAVVGAILMVVTGAIGFDDAARAVDARTIVLLFSMMVIVAHLRLAGGLAALAQYTSARVSHPAALLVLLVAVSGVLSALFVNDTICLVFTPLVLDLVLARGLRPLPFLLALATASNIGSVATITGNPQNILIGSLSGLTFGRFALALGPGAMAGLAIDAALLCLVFRRDLRPSAALPSPVPAVTTHPGVLWKTLVVCALVLAGFLGGYNTALVAAAGAAVLLVTRRVRPRKIYAAIDWDLLVLFVGLFVIVAAGERAGFDQRIFDWLAPLGVGTLAGLSATAAVVSNAISNVPAVMLLARLVPRLPDPTASWLALAMSSTLAGNLTILGSIANLIVVEGARRRGVKVGFLDYAAVGVPVTLLTLSFGVWWLSLRLY